ncbi:HD-GYP domain-containing protein [Geotalea daltonii]|nr:HD-GYP domain-containing protein [Geotalea daltonii]
MIESRLYERGQQISAESGGEMLTATTSLLRASGDLPTASIHGCGLTFLHQMAESLGRAIDARDPNTALHSEHVAELSLLIARNLGLDDHECNLIHIAGHLHDIGKIGVTDAVLKKEGPLSTEEQLEMRCHPVIGAQIVAPVGLCATTGGIADIIRCHHERYDGGGYPAGLRGAAIPIGARIVAVADTYSAIIQNRPYRPGTTPELAMAEIERCSGLQFDPDVVETFRNTFCHGRVHVALSYAGIPASFPMPDVDVARKMAWPS